MKSSILSFLLLGCLVSSSLSQLMPMGGLKGKPTTAVTTVVYTDEEIISGTAFEKQEKGVIVKATKSGCDCKEDVAEKESLESQMEVTSAEKPNGRLMQIALQSIKIALKFALAPLNNTTGGAVYAILDRVIPTKGNQVEKLLNMTNPKEMTTFIIMEVIEIVAEGKKYQDYADQFKGK